MVDWETAKPDFEWDGSWRDIYVFETTLEHWKLLFRLLRSGYQLEPSGDGGAESLPGPDDELQLPEEGSMSWQFRVGRIQIICHYFGLEQIEFDLDPRDLASQEDLDILLGFLQQLGDGIKKPVMLTPENCPLIPLITYDPKTGAFQRYEPAG